MFSGSELVQQLVQLGISHVIWVPDSDVGRWESDLQSSPAIQLVRVCREGEAWPLAAGLILAGATPMVILQTTGLFESGDALRNVVYDLQLPVFALIGARNWLNANSTDSARRFALPILEAWRVEYVMIESRADFPRLAEHYRTCRQKQVAGLAILAE